jgi:hypothetical protein
LSILLTACDFSKSQVVSEVVVDGKVIPILGYDSRPGWMSWTELDGKEHIIQIREKDEYQRNQERHPRKQ